MSATARFVSEADGFEARIDDETGEWVVSPVGIDASATKAAFVKSYLDHRAPENGDYSREFDESLWSKMRVEKPANWLRMVRAKEFFPDGDVVVDYHSSDDEGKNLIY